MLRHIVLCFLLIASFPMFLLAQKELPTESVDIIRDFDVRLLESNKLNVPPVLPPLDTSTKYQDYLVPPRQLTVQYEAPRLRPLGMRSVKADPPYNGYAKAGGGVPTSIYGEAGYYFGKAERFDGRAWFRHHSLNSKALENQRFFNNDFLLNGNLFLKNNVAVEGRVGYSFDRVHYYGYDHNDTTLNFGEERVRQDFKTVEIGGRVYNGEKTDAELNYSVAPNFYILNDFYSNREVGFNLSLTAAKWFAEKHVLRFTLRPDLTNFKDTAVQRLNNIYLQPSFTFHTDFMRLKIGGNFASNRDQFYAFPDAEINLRIFGDGFQLFAGATGDLRKNTYRSLSDYNPFIEIRESKLLNTRYTQYYGGLRGNLGWVDYSLQAGYGQALELALYQTFFTPERITRFRTVYDDATIYNLQGTLKIMPFRQLVVLGTLSNNVYELDKEAAAWGIPRLEGNFSATYTLLDGKASVRGALYVADGISRLDENGRKGRDQALLDVSAGGNYFFTDNFGAFLELNNLLNNKRERWYRYPMVGTNFLVGLTAKF